MMDKLTFEKLTDKERVRIMEGISYFASVHRINAGKAKKFSTHQYDMQLALDTPEAVEKAKSFGLRIKDANDNIPYPHVELKRKVKEPTPEKIDKAKPEVVSPAQKPFKELIGNGSRVRVRFGTYWYDNNGGGVGTSLWKIQVLEHVPFESGVDSDFVMDESSPIDTPSDEGWTIDETEDFPTSDVAFD